DAQAGEDAREDQHGGDEEEAFEGGVERRKRAPQRLFAATGEQVLLVGEPMDRVHEERPVRGDLPVPSEHGGLGAVVVEEVRGADDDEPRLAIDPARRRTVELAREDRYGYRERALSLLAHEVSLVSSPQEDPRGLRALRRREQRLAQMRALSRHRAKRARIAKEHAERRGVAERARDRLSRIQVRDAHPVARDLLPELG